MRSDPQRRRRPALGTAAAVPLAALAATLAPAGAATATADAPVHCVAIEESPAEIAAGVPTTITCYDTFASALAAAGGRRSATARAGGVTTAAFSYRALATHWTGYAPGSGSSLTVSGTDCNGGGISLSGSAFANSIRDTVHYACNTIKHYPSADYTGTPYTTQEPNGSDHAMPSPYDNDISSIKYYGPNQ